MSRPKHCPTCGSKALRFYRKEWGERGTRSFSWEEGHRCKDCKRVRIPEEPEPPPKAEVKT